MDKLIKIILIVLFLLCLADLPYGFYQFVRFAALIGFSFLAYIEFQNNNKAYVIIYIALALLFQPLIKISLGRSLWNIVDVIVAIFLLVSIFIHTNKNDNH